MRGGAREYHLISPDGERYSGTNLRAFCREHGLEYTCMLRVVSGERNKHRGWTYDFGDGDLVRVTVRVGQHRLRGAAQRLIGGRAELTLTDGVLKRQVVGECVGLVVDEDEEAAA
jgi:hypothetical protein